MDKLSNMEKLCQNNKLLQEVLTQKTEQDVIALLEKNAISVTVPELKKLKKLINLVADGATKVTEDELEKIAGGGQYDLEALQLFYALFEATLLIMRSKIESSDPNGVIMATRILEENSNPSAPTLSWWNVAKNATNGIVGIGKKTIKNFNPR